MAIYHASMTVVSRGTGGSAVAAAAYRAGEKLDDERAGLQRDFTRRSGVILSQTITPDGIEVDRAELWNAAEAAERRKDARTAREWRVALPSELSCERRAELAHRFAGLLVGRYGVAVDLALHEPGRGGDARNWHAHLLLTTRRVSRDGQGNLVVTAG